MIDNILYTDVNLVFCVDSDLSLRVETMAMEGQRVKQNTNLPHNNNNINSSLVMLQVQYPTLVI